MASNQNPYGKAPKGETAQQARTRRAKFYTTQREQAEAGASAGDKSAEAMKRKIYSKLPGGVAGKKARSLETSRLSKVERGTGEDPEKVNKAILGGVASTMGLRGVGKIGAAMRAGRGARAAASLSGDTPKALTGGVGRKATVIPRTRKLTGPTTRLEGKPLKALPKGKPLAGRVKRMGANTTQGPKNTYGKYKGGKATEKGVKQASKRAGTSAKPPMKGRVRGRKRASA